MQYGVLDRVARRRGSDVWTYRWRERGPSGQFIYRRRVIGTVKQFKNKVAARRATAGLVREINSQDFRVKFTAMTLAQLVEHYRLREIRPENQEKNYSTKAAYDCYLRKWILPRWGEHTLPSVRASEVEEWLRFLGRAPATRSKIRNVMSVVFNHAIRHDLYDRNPISQVRQSAKRRAAPHVLGRADIQAILTALRGVDRLMVLLAASTGLRQSELFALKWKDLDFESKQASVTRSIVHQVVGRCKTETSQKPVPLDDVLLTELQQWRRETPYHSPEDWVFASPCSDGKKPFWGQQIMRRRIFPVARRLGIKLTGWHTFRHSYSTLLCHSGTNLKVMQELLRHSTIRVTLDTYTQAVTSAKRAAQMKVASLIAPPPKK